MRRLLSDRSGAALLEFAFVLPLLLTFLAGVIEYSYWFYISHSVQTVANDAARASLAGLTASERSTLAQAAATNSLSRLGAVSAQSTTTTITDDGQSFQIRLTYDASHDPMLHIGPVPSPPGSISRSAIVSLNQF
jgi:Flp pilus assembly protein TadG